MNCECLFGMLRIKLLFFLVIMFHQLICPNVALGQSSGLAGYMTPAERALATDWMSDHFGDRAGSLPFSFKYGQTSSRNVLRHWDAKTPVKKSTTVKHVTPTLFLMLIQNLKSAQLQ